MTNGFGATLGTIAAGQVVNHYVDSVPKTEQIAGWETSWYIFAAYALAVAVLFWLIFRDDDDRKVRTDELGKIESTDAEMI